MKKFHLKSHLLLALLMIPLMAPWNAIIGANEPLDLKVREDRLLKLEKEIETRWEKVKKSKKAFAPYTKKSDREIINEFEQIKKLRDHWSDFNYTSIDSSYNANTILIHGHHFIGLKEPTPKKLPIFFDILNNHDVGMVVRLNPESEYFRRHKTLYWKNHTVQKEGLNCSCIQPKANKIIAGPAVPYLYTNQWVDNKGISVKELYRLVQDARESYEKNQSKGPIVCHCHAGRGRAGTFIAAYVIANMLDVLQPHELSIESIVLKLSIQRLRQVGTSAQYLTLYKFADYYLEQKKINNQQGK